MFHQGIKYQLMALFFSHTYEEVFVLFSQMTGCKYTKKADMNQKL